LPGETWLYGLEALVTRKLFAWAQHAEQSLNAAAAIFPEINQ
jgi:hypothetical protein